MIDSENMSSLAARLRDNLSFDWNFHPAAEGFSDWKDRTRNKVRQALGVGRIAPASASVVTEWAEDGCRAQELELGFSNGETTRAYLLRPDTNDVTPAVLLLHDHGSFFSIGKEKMIRRSGEACEIAADADRWAAKLYGGRHVGNELARRGYTVLCADALGWGSRKGNGYEAQQALAANLMQFGVSYASVILLEDLEAMAWLRALPGVDGSRVASFGYSMGGSRAWQAAALSDDARVCVAGGWMGTLQGLMQPGNNQLRGQSAFSMLHPPIAGKIDYPHFAGLAAPKPALIFSGAEDRHFPVPAALAAQEQLHAIWAAADAERCLETRLWPGAAHAFPVDQQDHAMDWLDRAM
ncbi:dienelactone hydrolase family protein [Neorhizobium galegae]|uniref:dienelactone hydrolase family protein n=1 Tax=Neorhizobium galegae TaxID=399 RepID=UPI000622399E|nr:dienelactone hydrolase family protein [Neorhizobium galegae]CDZ46616.1 Dienelactone hydrolase family protein [Neorhizobium galegae bv. orientalis]